MPTYLSPGVYVEETESGSRPLEGVGTAVAAFVGFAGQGPYHTPTLVTNWTQFTQTFGGFIEGSYLAHAVYGYMANGGAACYVVRVGAEPGDGAPPDAEAARELAASPQTTIGSYRVRAVGADGKYPNVTVEVSDSTAENPPADAVRLVIRVDGKQQEEFDPVVPRKGSAKTHNLAAVVNAKSAHVRVDEAPAAGAVEQVDRGRKTLTAPPPSAPTPESLDADDYVGNAADRTGFGGLEAVDEVTMVAVPDLMSAYQHGALDLEAVQAVQLAMISHCEQMGDRVAILDPPPGLTAQQVKEWRVDKAGYDSKFATLYWPWPKVFDPATGENVHVPPCGHIGGIWARNDDTRGVHKAPANEVIRGAIALETQITKAEHDLLNPIGVNCLRAFPARGIRVWGARSLSSDPAWRYLNIRRYFNYLEETILLGTQWVVFEPNDEALWARIRRTISAFLVNEWRSGALFGATPTEAFYVKCDGETNIAESIDAGQVICEIGVAPVKPAEFVIFRLAQFSGGTSLVNE